MEQGVDEPTRLTDSVSEPSIFSESVESASAMFADAGVPKSPRTISRYCELGHLDCSKADTKTGEKYLITKDSIVRRIEEVRQQLDNTRHGESLDNTRHGESRNATVPTESDTGADMRPELHAENLKDENEELKKENKRLEGDVRDLRITNQAKDQFIEMVQRERSEFVELIQSKSHRIGALETELRQLESKNSDSSRVIGSSVHDQDRSRTPSPE